MARLFGQGNCLTSDQQEAIGETEIADTSCYGAYINTCGVDSRELLSLYPIYDPLEGLFLTKWGEIDVPWGEIDQEWGEVKLLSDFGYLQGDKVLWFDREGDYFVVYEAVDNTARGPGPFDEDEWQEVCRIRTTDRSLLSEIITKYPYWSGSVEQGIVKIDTDCGDYSCLYITNSSVISETSPPNPEFWTRLFCAKNGKKNTCSKVITCGPNRVLVSLSSGDNDLVCVPVESSDGIGPRK